VSHEAVYGELASVEIALHVPASAGEDSKATCWTPTPVSLGEAERLTVPRSGLPGSTRPPPGAVASTVHVNTAALPSVLPAVSVLCTLKVWLPSARPV
jgi:hypothetical protein